LELGKDRGEPVTQKGERENRTINGSGGRLREGR